MNILSVLKITGSQIGEHRELLVWGNNLGDEAYSSTLGNYNDLWSFRV